MSAIDEAVERVRWEDEVVRGSPGSAMARRASSELTQLRAQVRALTVARDENVQVRLDKRRYMNALVMLSSVDWIDGKSGADVLRLARHALDGGDPWADWCAEQRARKGET